MGENRARLLRSLAIDRSGSEQAAPAVRPWPRLVASGVVAIAALLAGLWLLLPQLGGRAEQRVPVSAEAHPTTPAKAPAPSAEQQQAGGLSASGYVVARRKATVA